MDKVCVHIGLSLFAVKCMCESMECCKVCPLCVFCEGNFTSAPCSWDDKVLPDVDITVHLTETEEE